MPMTRYVEGLRVERGGIDRAARITGQDDCIASELGVNKNPAVCLACGGRVLFGEYRDAS